MVISWNGTLLNYTFFRYKRFKNAWENSLYGHESNLLVIKISEEVYEEIKRDYLKIDHVTKWPKVYLSLYE